jgi:hypothetical protein
VAFRSQGARDCAYTKVMDHVHVSHFMTNEMTLHTAWFLSCVINTTNAYLGLALRVPVASVLCGMSEYKTCEGKVVTHISMRWVVIEKVRRGYRGPVRKWNVVCTIRLTWAWATRILICQHLRRGKRNRVRLCTRSRWTQVYWNEWNVCRRGVIVGQGCCHRKQGVSSRVSE